MTMTYYEDDADLSTLDGRVVGIFGYDDTARAVAQNLLDSGVRILVSLHDEGDSTVQREAVEADGVMRLPPAEVAQQASVLMLLLPDESMPPFYMAHISPHLQRGQTLIFLSGYTIAFGYIDPPPFVDVGLVSPRMLGAALRGKYLAGEGFGCFVAVGQDASRGAWSTVLALALAVGGLRSGAIEISLEQEAQLTLFVQQAIITSFHHLMTTAVNLLLGAGYPAEAVLSDLYISGRFSDYLRRADQAGLLNAVEQESLTGQYATLSRLNRFSEMKLERLMEVTLEEVQHGDFAREWAREFTDGYPRLKKLLKFQQALDVWLWEQQALDMLER